MKNISPGKKIELKAILKELLLKEGLSIKEAAKELDIHRKTVWVWIGEDGYSEQLKKVRAGVIKLKRNVESLSEFEAKIRVRHPHDYPLIKQRIDEYRKPIFKAI